MRAMVHETPGGAETLMPMVVRCRVHTIDFVKHMRSLPCLMPKLFAFLHSLQRYAQVFGNDTVCRAILLSELGEPDVPIPRGVIDREGNATTDFRDIGRHAQTVTRIVYHASTTGNDMTMAMLIKAWRATKDTLECVADCPPKDLTSFECELIIVALLLENMLKFHVHWTAYQAVAYIQLGQMAEPFLMSTNPIVRVRFPRMTKKGPTPQKSAANPAVTGWVSAKRKPAAKKAGTKKKAATKKTAVKMKKTVTKKSKKTPAGSTKRTKTKQKQSNGSTLDTFFTKGNVEELDEEDVIVLSSDEESDTPQKSTRKTLDKVDDDLWQANNEDDEEVVETDDDEEFEFE
jgi:hypothetical protein